jgi:hypothetical protein
MYISIDPDFADIYSRNLSKARFNYRSIPLKPKDIPGAKEKLLGSSIVNDQYVDAPTILDCF